MTEPHYFTIQTAEGYSGVYETRQDAEHARRLQFGIRATAHAIIRVAGRPRRAHNEEAPRWIGDNAPLIGESIAADVRSVHTRTDDTRRFLEGDTLDPRCTGYIDELGYLAHDGDTCPVHESGDVDPGDETESLDPDAAWRAYNDDAALPAPLLDQLASLARTALTDVDSIGDLEAETAGLHHHYPAGTAPGLMYAVAMLDKIINAVNPAELDTTTAPEALAVLGRQIESFRERLESENVIEPGRSMIGDAIAAALDQLDQAIDALKGGDDD